MHSRSRDDDARLRHIATGQCGECGSVVEAWERGGGWHGTPQTRVNSYTSLFILFDTQKKHGQTTYRWHGLRDPIDHLEEGILDGMEREFIDDIDKNSYIDMDKLFL